ncbi:hypothetical protein CROQUDRAFT_45402 [Cronartium quercuum f. sp. fusiforme G11]|uniref:DDE-1 domain-containing protein n=1 Tax=Cronartium quercuum f. sp. fusiforme G11 TaxID=708437 RepID=A0A9P6NKA5_9BASI|nr:hypothetical protein CROQUDRAFT_45402 [Cronartium quercuum f. sp. fusiforme G11]
MTGQIFGDWLQKLDHKFCKESQKILLLLDNFSGHKAPVKTLNLTNIDVYFIPPNLTSHLQPCDAGIIAAWKAHYRCDTISLVISKYKDNPQRSAKEVYRLPLLDAMQVADLSWKHVSCKTILNCWKHTRIIAALNQQPPSSSNPS